MLSSSSCWNLISPFSLFSRLHSPVTRDQQTSEVQCPTSGHDLHESLSAAGSEWRLVTGSVSSLARGFCLAAVLEKDGEPDGMEREGNNNRRES